MMNDPLMAGGRDRRTRPYDVLVFSRCHEKIEPLNGVPVMETSSGGEVVRRPDRTKQQQIRFVSFARELAQRAGLLPPWTVGPIYDPEADLIADAVVVMDPGRDLVNERRDCIERFGFDPLTAAPNKEPHRE